MSEFTTGRLRWLDNWPDRAKLQNEWEIQTWETVEGGVRRLATTYEWRDVPFVTEGEEDVV